MQQFPAPLKTKAMLVLENRLGEPMEDYLRRRYLDEGATTQQIGDELRLNNATISRWLTILDIEARFPGQRGKPAEVLA